MSIFESRHPLFVNDVTLKAECDKCGQLHEGVDANRPWADEAAMDAARDDGWDTPPAPTLGDFAIWCPDCIAKWNAEVDA